jgi:hypothetical protein
LNDVRLPVLFAVFTSLAIACSALPQTFPSDAPRRSLVAVDATQIVVKENLKIAPSLTAIVLPADTYIPVRTDHSGTFYESPRGILIVPVVGAPFLVSGGLYRTSDASKRYQLSIYGALVTWPLNVRYGARLKGIIECTPTCELP